MSALKGFFDYKANKAQDKSAAFQREAAELQQKQVNLQNARNKRDAVREARIAFGAAQNTAANQGVSASSSSLGGLSSISAQASDNVSFLDQFGFYSDQASKALGNASRQDSKARGYQAASGFITSIQNAGARMAGGG
jgi:BRCT domain type II-containing protein